MADRCDVFLSYSRNDREAATALRAQLTQGGLSVFKDDDSIRAGDLWLDQLQAAIEACGAFVVLVGRDRVARWIGAETQAALNRSFGPHADAERLPIFPILLGETQPETLPAFLRLFQTTTWNGSDPLPRLLDQVGKRRIVATEAAVFEGCPFVGLAAYRIDQAQLFFGRQKETLDALACFETRGGRAPVRWLEINGNSGSGKSSLMNAGLLPLIDQGWLWPRTGIAQWRRIGPMMPGAHPVEMLAECLGRTFRVEMDDVCARLQARERVLARWLRSRKQDDTAFLLAIDQFEELFTFADPEERRHFDQLLATALEDPDCPLFIISTVRADFLDRFEELPHLVAARNRLARPWTLAPIGPDGLREVIDGPARLAGLDVSEVKEAMVAEAQDEPGALPLVENALHWLWEKREGDRLPGRLFTEQGGLAGILSGSADGLLASLGKPQRERALELLFRLVQVDPEARRHTRRRIPLAEAIDVAGGGERGRALVDRLAGQHLPSGAVAEGSLRLITVTEEAATDAFRLGYSRSVNLIHETLIRSKGLDAKGKARPCWPTLWNYIVKHKERAAWLERLEEDTQLWVRNGRRASDLWSHERVREAVAALGNVGVEIKLTSDEQEFLGPINPEAMLAELERLETAHRRRALIGERLDVLGDPRQGVLLGGDGTPEIAWHAIPAGEVVIEGKKKHGGRQLRRRYVKGGFHIARHPITVAQYRAFVEADDGWRKQAWWHDDLYRDPDGDIYEFGRFGNHPAVYVSWFDAMAFCRWLSGRLGLVVGLPSEWEWQLAATGGDATRTYPWGPEWEPKQDTHLANTFESRLGALTAVGMYPAGAAKTGPLDMAGTVWEWCLDKRAGEHNMRVLRGGSWYSYHDHALCADRIWHYSNFRDGGIGIRVLCRCQSLSTHVGGAAPSCRHAGRG